MDNNHQHSQAVINQGKMKVTDITHWLRMDNTEGNMDIGLDLLFEQTLISDDQQPVMDRQTDYAKGKNNVESNRSPDRSETLDVQEVKPDAHEVHDVQKVNKTTGKDNIEPARSSDKSETIDVDAQEVKPDAHAVHDV